MLYLSVVLLPIKIMLRLFFIIYLIFLFRINGQTSKEVSQMYYSDKELEYLNILKGLWISNNNFTTKICDNENKDFFFIDQILESYPEGSFYEKGKWYIHRYERHHEIDQVKFQQNTFNITTSKSKYKEYGDKDITEITLYFIGNELIIQNSDSDYISICNKCEKNDITGVYEVVKSNKETIAPTSSNLESTFNSFKIKIRKNRNNINVRKEPVNGKVIAMVSEGETYRVTDVSKTNKPLYLLKNNMVLTDLITGEKTEKPVDFKLNKVREIDNQIYYAELINNNKSINKVYLNKKNVKIEYNNWFYLEELQGWIYSAFCKKL